MRHRIALASITIALLWPLLPAPTAVSAAPGCESLKTFTLPGGIIDEAQSVPGPTFMPPGGPTLTDLPAFCRVAGRLMPTSQSVIGFEVWMPATTWNRNFRGEGSGGSAGAFSYAAMGAALRLGFATISTDNGHKGSAWTFAAQPEKVNDFGYRAFHTSTVAAKTIVHAFYHRGPRHSYFVGCSQGGHHGLMEAQRYPDDYDGIVAGDPGNYWTHLMVGELWTGDVSSVKGPSTDLPQAKLDLITRAVLDACGDPVNGPLGFLVEPRRCHFDPSQLQCQAGDAPDCLTADELQAVDLIYQGAVNPRTGEPIFPGFVRGSENAWRQVLVGAHIGSMQIPGGSSYEFFRNGIFMNPNYDFLSFNFDSDVLLTDTKRAGSGLTYAEALNAIDPDLEPFAKRGGKLIMYHGFADPFVTPLNTINYYADVIRATHSGRGHGGDDDDAGGLDRTMEFARLFMVPGMWHCAGGPGPSMFDVFTPLVHWVEHGITPDRIVGTHPPDATGHGGFTRPLCPFPREAVYNGSGATTDAASFSCRLGEDRHRFEDEEDRDR